jgi:hypothetical protein
MMPLMTSYPAASSGVGINAVSLDPEDGARSFVRLVGLAARVRG